MGQESTIGPGQVTRESILSFLGSTRPLLSAVLEAGSRTSDAVRVHLPSRTGLRRDTHQEQGFWLAERGRSCLESR